MLEDYVDQGLPGLILLIRDSSGVWTGSAGMSDIGEDVSMQPCHTSKVASITKPFIATLVMMLVEEQVISLDDRVGEWISPEKLEGVENARNATIRQLMNHTSGVFDVISDDDFYLSVLNHPQKEWKPQELLGFVEDQSAYFSSGKGVHYSNTNYLLLSMVLEKATGKPHHQLLHNRILEPLNLENTVYHYHDDLPENTAQGYYDLYNDGDIRNLTNYNTGNGNGYNGIYSTVKDLQVFIEVLVRNQSLLEGGTVDQMLDFDVPVENGKKNGLGLYKDFIEHPAGTYAYGHRGRDLAYSGDMYWFPEEDYTMVTLVNYGADGESKLRPVYRAYLWEVVSVLVEK